MLGRFSPKSHEILSIFPLREASRRFSGIRVGRTASPSQCAPHSVHIYWSSTVPGEIVFRDELCVFL